MIRVGVIGYGYWGPNLVRNFADVPRPGLLRCAICDRSDLRRRSAATPVSSRHPTRRR